ncbi:hypothetical protein N8571_01945 [Akkermansiaceae bacterium]|nr:hypothetical protein [Akkermansiaceae bacterium]
MPYIGNTSPSRFVSNRAASVYSGDGSTTAFTLEQAVVQDEDILVSVDGVVQEPSVAYAVSNGTTLTFTGAPSSDSGNNIFVYYLASQVGTVGHPSNQALSATSGTFSGNTTVAGTSTFTGDVTVGDGSAADKKILFDGNAQDYHIGLDDSNDSLTIGLGSALGTTSHMVIDANGHITKPLQSAFSAKRDATASNLATNSFLSFATEAFDQNSDFSGDTFTAPVSGRYQLNFITRIDQIDRDSNWVRFTLVTSNQTVEANIIDPGVFASDPTYWNFTIAYLADMDASDTAKIQFQFDGGSQIADISSHSYFSGYLVA